MTNNMINADYIKILDFYKIEIPKNKKLLQKQAEKILADKLCRCIKKIDNKSKSKNEARSIGICTQSIFNRKKLTRGKFTCKKKRSVQFRKTTEKNNK